MSGVFKSRKSALASVKSNTLQSATRKCSPDRDPEGEIARPAERLQQWRLHPGAENCVIPAISRNRFWYPEKRPFWCNNSTSQMLNRSQPDFSA